MIISFHEQAWEDYLYWQQADIIVQLAAVGQRLWVLTTVV